MTEEFNIVKNRFLYFNLEGSSYEIGQKIGQNLKENIAALNFFSSGKPKLEKLGFKNLKELKEHYEAFIPGLADETQGYIDTLEDPQRTALIYGSPHSFKNNCSHMVALPSITKNKKILVGRSYEWNHREEDLVLSTTRVNGKAKHIGFTMLLFGRYEGLNEFGLCVTSSGGGGYSLQDTTKGIPFSLAVRSSLENCKTANEASNYLIDIPTNTTNNYIISDKTGKAFLLECLNFDYSIKEIDVNSEEQFLISTNHYTLPDKQQFNERIHRWLLHNSKTRNKIIRTQFIENKNSISKEIFRAILSTEIPEGLCAYYYSISFGTVWSMIFDVTEKEIEISFGSPSHNKWIKFDLKSTYDTDGFKAIFPEKQAPKF